MQYYSESLTSYKRIHTRPVKVGNLVIGGGHPIRVQTMTTTDTMDTDATVAQVIRCIEAGAELVRVTAPSKKEAENVIRIIRFFKQGMSPIHHLLTKKEPYKKKASPKPGSGEATHNTSED